MDRNKLFTVLLILLMVFTVAGCGSKESGEPAVSDDAGAAETETAETLTADSFRTMSDVFDLSAEGLETSVMDNKAVYAFKYGDIFYRAVASMTDEEQQAYMDVDFSDDDYEDQQRSILAPLAIDQFDNLNEKMLKQDELDALAGRTGQELMDSGWTTSGNFNLESKEIWMNYGPFMYDVVFDGEFDLTGYDTSNIDEYDVDSAIKDMPVKSVSFDSLSNAAYDIEN
ncbi:MAG: hypothetical protein IJH95_00905 [Mogibacterium sp.]|nr:hypothetical protein [Mogibacterium sp.]